MPTLQIRVSGAQKELLTRAAGDLSLSEYVLGQLFDLSPRLNETPRKIAVSKSSDLIPILKPINSRPIPGTPVDMPTQPGAIVELVNPIGKPWIIAGKQRSMFKRPDGTEYEGWL
jgi:hypothetical protein